MTIHPRHVLTAFKPKLIEHPKKFADKQWSLLVAKMNEAISACEDFAGNTIHEAPGRMSEHTTILENSATQAQNRRIAMLGASAAMAFDEMYGGDPNYTPDLPPDCEFASIGENA